MHSFAAVVVLCLACASTALADVYRLKADFVETSDSRPNSRLEGTLYYLYNTSSSSACRLRFEYNVPNYGVVANLYDYSSNAVFSMCSSSCTAGSLQSGPDPWWFNSQIYERTSDPEVSGMYWYQRITSQSGQTATLQVKRILMKSSTTPSSNSIRTIEFYDGRRIEVSNVAVNPSTLPATSSKFSIDSGLNCPIPSCSIYADIAFVLDYSGSVTPTEWGLESDFVLSMMDRYTFDDYGAAAAVIQYNAPSCGRQPTWTLYNDCSGENEGKRPDSDWTYDELCSGSEGQKPWYQRSCCTTQENASEHTASVLAGAGTGNSMTVSTNKNELISAMSVSRTPAGGSCRAFGLELAMKVFDRSPRNNYGYNPQRIVIVVSDGYDYCPNATRAAAAKLKDQYGALIIGVGVGFACQYDRDLFMSITSQIAGQAAYFDAIDFSYLPAVADQTDHFLQMIIAPVCSQTYTECGPECKGFCGCGECFCPTCDSTGNMCQDYRCVAGGGASNGCVLTDISSCPEDDRCTQYVCDGASGSCSSVRTCAEVEANNPGTCRSVKCNLKDGSCSVELRHDYCSNLLDTNCEKYECAGEGVTSGVGYDATTGCILKRNVTQECASQNNGCKKYICDAESGQCVGEDTCRSQNTACMTYECSSSGKCVGTATIAPAANTSCREYACDNQAGWYISFEKTAQWCRDNWAGDKRCKTFRCDESVAGGCTYDVIDGCVVESSEPVIVSSSSSKPVESSEPVIVSSSSSKPVESSEPVIISSSSSKPVESSEPVIVSSSSSKHIVSSVSHSSASHSSFACPDGQYVNLTSMTCIECARVLNCATCSNGYSCDSCNKHFRKTELGCIPICGDLHGEGCMKCTANKCLECVSKDCCDKMHYFWDENSSRCMDPADKFGDGCVEANEYECTKCTAPSCCKTGEYFGKSECHSCEVFGDSCSRCIESGCVECGNNETAGINGTCESCSRLFGNGCKTCGEYQCRTVDDGYMIIGTNAIECSSLFGDGCSKCNSSVGCESCPEGMAAINGFCRDCSKTFGEECQKCSSESCTECNGIMMNRACVGCSSAYGPGCKECNISNGCTEVETGYFISGKFAFSCSVLPNEPVPLQDCCMSGDNTLCPPPTVRQAIRDDEGSIVVNYNENPVEVSCSEMTTGCKSCTVEGGEAKCVECEKGFVLVGGTCEECNDHVSDGQCSECTLTGCSTCSDSSMMVSNDGTCVSCGDDETFDVESRMCVKCESLYHECSKCDASGCVSCESGLIVHEGMCKTCGSIHGSGCTECDNETCFTCISDDCCARGTKIVSDENGEVKCGSCEVYGEKCVNCTATKCRTCEEGYFVNSENGRCIPCEEVYEGCGKCTSDMCVECKVSSWTLTNYGCIDLSEFVTSSHGSEPLKASSVASSSNGQSGPDIILIIGIAVGVVVAAAIVVVIIIVVVVMRKRGRKNKNDGGVVFDDDESGKEMDAM